MPSPYALRRISTGLYAIKPPRDGRTGWLSSEYAREIGVDPATVWRWAKLGLIHTEKRGDFSIIPVDEGLRFSKEGPRP
jgi:hypothetical protein